MSEEMSEKEIEQMLYDKGIAEVCRLEDEKYFVNQAMRKYGGSFSRGLGEALLHADPNNTNKIFNTWHKDWQHFLNLGKKDPRLNDIYQNEVDRSQLAKLAHNGLINALWEVIESFPASDTKDKAKLDLIELKKSIITLTQEQADGS